MTSLLFCCSLSGCPLVAFIFVNRYVFFFEIVREKQEDEKIESEKAFT